MELKPQDLFVVLKIVAARCKRPPYLQLATSLGLSLSETHAAVQRAEACHLLAGQDRDNRPNLAALQEFLLHGLKYVFPPERGEFTRGVATAYAAKPLSEKIAPGSDPIPVWPSPEGKDRGNAFSPLYKSAPAAAMRDPVLYEYLALTDALRDGRPRERTLAAEELKRLLQQAAETAL